MSELNTPFLTKNTLRGTWGTVLLPIQADEHIDVAALTDEVDALIRAGVSGVYTNGSAGEFFNQTDAEFDEISALVAERCRRVGMPFQLGVCQAGPLQTLDRIRRGKALQPGAFQVILPDWLPLNAEEQVAFLQKVAEAAAPVPLVLYHPPHAKARLTPPDFSRLAAAVPELIGLKVATGDAAWYAAMREAAPALAVFVPGHRLATGIAQGVGVGAYSNVACLHPVAARRWYEGMQTDPAEALRVEARIWEFFQTCILPFARLGYCDPALDKLLAAVGGWCAVGTRLRWPYRGIDPAEVPVLQRVARRLLPSDFFNPIF